MGGVATGATATGGVTVVAVDPLPPPPQALSDKAVNKTMLEVIVLSL